MEFKEFSTSQLILIDKHCTRFERALRKQQAVSLEQILDPAATDIQRPLFKELLYLELAYRRQRGEVVNRDEYTGRFPDFIDLIDEVWPQVFACETVSGFAVKQNNALETIHSGLTIPGYEIKTRLARGGMGVVYHARDLTLDREVAIKMLAGDSMSMEQLERFRLEAAAIGALHHRHIIQIYSVGEHHGQPYLALEYANGGTLKDRLEAGPLRRDEVIRMMMTLAKTIEFIHANGFLHRDLKPSNVLFDKHDTIKISDFGLAKHISSATELTQTQTQMGTPAYMAPEQVDKRFGKVSELSDIFSLGVLMHSLLTGVAPYAGLETAELLKALVSDKDVPKTRLLERSIDKALMTVCLRCLEKQPRHRYQSATSLFDDLKRLQSGRAVSRRIPVGKYLNRYLAPVMVGVLLLAGAGYLMERSQTKSDIAEKTGLLASRVIGQLDPAVLASLNAPYRGEEDFKLVSLLPAAGPLINHSPLKSPQGLALYRDRYLYIADTLNNRVLLIDLMTGDIAHVAGRGEANYSGDNGPARNATLNQPAGLDVDANGNLYIADRGNHALRVVNTDGIITTLSGGVGCRNKLRFDTIPDLCYPEDVSVVSADEYFIADAFHQRIRYTNEKKKILSSVYKRNGADATAGFTPYPRAMAYDDGVLYFIEGHAGRLRRLDRDGTLTTLADGFIEPAGIGLDNKGNIYVGDEAGYPLTRVNKATGAVEILKHDRLFLHSPGSPETQTVTAIAIGGDNRLFFSNAVDNSVAVVIPREGELEMVARDGNGGPRRIRYPLQRLDDTNRYRYFGVNKPELFSDIAYRLGLHLYIHRSVTLEDNFTLNQEHLSVRKLLILVCLTYNVSCGIEGDTLVVAAPDVFPAITSAAPIRITNPLTYIENADSMPDALKREMDREIRVEAGVRKIPDEFFLMLEKSSLFAFKIDPVIAKSGKASLDLDGNYNLGQLLVFFVMLEKLKLKYDDISGKIIVGPWQ